MTMKHTKGPWKVNPYQHSMIHGFAVYSDKSCLDKIADDIKSEANAHLIAAAPEMLEALERLVKIYHDKEDDSEAAALDQAMDAIKKARGE